VFNADMHYGNQRNGHTKEKWVVDWGLTYRWPTRLRWPLLRLLKGLAERDPSHVQSALKALHVKRDTLPQPQVLRSLAQSLIKMEAEPLSQINGAFAREVAKAGWHPSGPTVLLLRSLLLCMADALRYDPDFKPGWRMYLELARQGARPAAREFGHFLGQRARRSFRRTRRRLARSWYSLGPRAALAQ